MRILVNAVSGGEDPALMDEHAAAPMADEAHFGVQELERDLPRPRAPLAGPAVEDAPRGGGGGGGGGGGELLPASARRSRLPLGNCRTAALCNNNRN